MAFASYCQPRRSKSNIAGLGNGRRSPLRKGLEQDYACLNIIDLDLIGQQVVKCLVRGVNITPYDPCKVFDQRTGERVHELYYSNAEKQ